MPREHVDYRSTMEELNRVYPDKYLLTQAEAASFLGVSVRTVQRRYAPGKRRMLTKSEFARCVCNG